MAQKNWSDTTSDLILKIPLIWFTGAGIRLALTILFTPFIIYLLYPNLSDAIRQIAMHAR